MHRKIAVGDVLGEVFSIYRENAGVLIPVAFWLFLVVAIVNGVAGTRWFMIALALAVGVAIGTLYQGMVVQLVRDVEDGRRDSSAGDLLRSAAPFIGPLVGVGIFAGICIGLGIIALVVPGLFLLTIWAVIAPAIVVERAGVFESLGRSRDLVRGNGWQVFGVIVVTYLIVVIGSMIFVGIAEAIADGALLRIVFSALASTITAPVGALVASVLYFRLRGIEGEPADVAAPVPAGPAGAGETPPAPPAV